MDLTLAACGSEWETARLFVGLCKSVWGQTLYVMQACYMLVECYAISRYSKGNDDMWDDEYRCALQYLLVLHSFITHLYVAYKQYTFFLAASQSYRHGQRPHFWDGLSSQPHLTEGAVLSNVSGSWTGLGLRWALAIELMTWCTDVAPYAYGSPTHINLGYSKLCGSSKDLSVRALSMNLKSICWFLTDRHTVPSQEKTLLTSEDENYTGMLYWIFESHYKCCISINGVSLFHKQD